MTRERMTPRRTRLGSGEEEEEGAARGGSSAVEAVAAAAAAEAEAPATLLLAAPRGISIPLSSSCNASHVRSSSYSAR